MSPHNQSWKLALIHGVRACMTGKVEHFCRRIISFVETHVSCHCKKEVSVSSPGLIPQHSYQKHCKSE